VFTKVRGIKKQFRIKDSKVSKDILKARRSLIQIQKHQENKRIQLNASKSKFLRKELNTETLQIQIENLLQTKNLKTQNLCQNQILHKILRIFIYYLIFLALWKSTKF
jgi:hypothetical protein